MSIKIANDTANGSSTLQPSNTGTGDVTHTLPAFTTELAPRMQLMTAQNSTSGTSIDFTGIPSWAKKITVMFSGVSTNGTSLIIIQLGSVTLTTSGYLSTASGMTTVVGTAASTIGFCICDNNIAAYTLTGAVYTTTFNGLTWCETGAMSTLQAKTTVSSGSVTLSSTLDRIRITTVNGTDTFDAGQINILVEG